MSDRPMHTVPGLFDRLSQIYAAGEQALNEQRFADAVALFSEGIGLDDHFRQRYVTMYAQRAFARQRLGDAMGAIPDYTRAIEMEPPTNQAQYHFHRGMCFEQIGGHDEHAVQDYGKAIALYPDHPGPYHLRGKLYAGEMARYAEAIADFDRLLALRPHPEGYQLRGFCKLSLGRAAEAIPDLMEANRLSPETYTDYLLAWAGAVAPDDELFFRSMEAVMRADPSYRPYFADNEDYARFRGNPRYQRLLAL